MTRLCAGAPAGESVHWTVCPILPGVGHPGPWTLPLTVAENHDIEARLPLLRFTMPDKVAESGLDPVDRDRYLHAARSGIAAPVAFASIEREFPDRCRAEPVRGQCTSKLPVQVIGGTGNIPSLLTTERSKRTGPEPVGTSL